jgi:hypothetical protein
MKAGKLGRLQDEMRQKEPGRRRVRAYSNDRFTLHKNPWCVRCRVRMQKANVFRSGRRDRFYRCRLCLSSTLIPLPRKHLARCIPCRAPMYIGGRQRQYLRCDVCKHQVARQGIKRFLEPQQHLASCVKCHRRMFNVRHKGALVKFQCRKCGVSAMHRYTVGPSFSDEQLVGLVEGLVPKSLWSGLRQEVCSDLLIAFLETRRRRKSNGLFPRKINSAVIDRFIRAALRRTRHELKEVSIFAGERPLIGVLQG